MKIDILLSTFNGAAFLDDLLQSLYGQTYSDWRLLIRDDGSTDDTVDLLNRWYEKDKERITILNSENRNIGPKKSFEKLLEYSKSDYIMFCDQDDYWLPDKVQNTLTRMKELEQHHPGKPVQVFSDLTVVDQDLKVLHHSFWEYTKVHPENVKNIYRLLINNPVVGCTVMINKVAKLLVLPIPDDAVMHDWWIALNVAQKGVVDFLNYTTILYRLHQNNSIGAVSVNRKYYSKRLIHLSKTVSQNLNVYKMSRSLNLSLSFLKLIGYKVMITFSKICK